jgi:hypothetical protein
MPTPHCVLSDDLLEASDFELLERAESIANRLEDDELYYLLEEFFERFAPAAQIQRLRRIYQDDQEAFADERMSMARRAFRRTYGVSFRDVADQEDV